MYISTIIINVENTWKRRSKLTSCNDYVKIPFIIPVMQFSYYTYYSSCYSGTEIIPKSSLSSWLFKKHIRIPYRFATENANVFQIWST